MKEITLINSDKKVLVDDEDYLLYSKVSWRLMSGYAAKQVRYGKRSDNKRRYIFLHKLILNTDNIVDHKDRNKLNCQKINLRSCTAEQNNRNRSKVYYETSSTYFGVTIGRNDNYVAYITYKGVKKYFGTNHKNEHTAAIAYNKGIEVLKDDFIPKNIIPQDVLERLKQL